jgi:Helicase associated domain
LTAEREAALQELHFVWDSHAAAWQERWQELAEFVSCHGHANVPKQYPDNPKLAIWVKCQRRQYKLLLQGQKSNLSLARYQKLQQLGFVFCPRRGSAGNNNTINNNNNNNAFYRARRPSASTTEPMPHALLLQFQKQQQQMQQLLMNNNHNNHHDNNGGGNGGAAAAAAAAAAV